VFIVKIMNEHATIEKPSAPQKNILKKINTILVEIIKKELGSGWTTAISEIIEAAKGNAGICANNLKLLKLLSEEIFDYSKENLGSQQIATLKSKFTEEFKAVYILCDSVIKAYISDPQSVRPQLVISSLDTLHTFLSWMPLYYIFMTDLIDKILIELMDKDIFASYCVKCFNEIFSLPFDGLSPEDTQNSKMRLLNCLNLLLDKLQGTIPKNRDLRTQRNILVSSGDSNKLAFFDGNVKAYVTFFTGLFEAHFDWIVAFLKTCPQEHRPQLNSMLNSSLLYMAMFCEIESEQIFEGCMVFWDFFATKINQFCVSSKNKKADDVLSLGNSQEEQMQNLFNSFFDNDTKARLMNSLIEKMAKPQEVIFVLDENGLPKKHVYENTSHSVHYERMKNVICTLAKTSFKNLSGIIKEHVNRMMGFTVFSKLNCLCWAIGTISGYMPPSEEKQFLIIVIRNLRSLVDIQKTTPDKSTVASNMMYIIGQYPNFLKCSIQFFWCIVSKLFEFMGNKFDEVKQMAVNTLLKICESCGDEMMKMKSNPDSFTGNPGFETSTWEILNGVQEKTKELKLPHKIVFYEAIGKMLSFVKNDQVLAHCLQTTLTPIMDSWKNLLQNSGADATYLKSEETTLNISFFVNVNEKMCATIGSKYITVFGIVV